MAQESTDKTRHNWLVTYRDNDGHVQVLELEAKDRGDVFRQLAEKRISAVKVEEAGIKQFRNKRKASKPKTSALFKRLIVAVIVVVGGLLLWIILRPKASVKDFPELSDQPPQTVKIPSVPVDVPSPETIEVEDKGAETDEPRFPYETWLGKKVIGYSCSTNLETEVITERLLTDDGGKHSIDTKMKRFEVSTSDQLLLLAVGVNPSRQMPPTPFPRQMSDEAVRRDLATEIRILPADTEQERNAKERLIALRREVLSLMDEGYSFDDVLRQHQAELARSTELRREAQEAVNELAEEGDREAAYELANRLNEQLDEFGAEHVQVPLSDEEKEVIRQEMSKKYNPQNGEE